jgi:hypothetical protein
MFSAMSCSPAEMKIFWPVMLVAAVVLRLGLGAHQAQIGAAMRLGQVHRAGPVAGRPSSAGRSLLRVRAMGQDRRGRAMGQALIHGEGHVGRENISPTAVFIR